MYFCVSRVRICCLGVFCLVVSFLIGWILVLLVVVLVLIWLISTSSTTIRMFQLFWIHPWLILLMFKIISNNSLRVWFRLLVQPIIILTTLLLVCMSIWSRSLVDCKANKLTRVWYFVTKGRIYQEMKLVSNSIYNSRIYGFLRKKKTKI